MTSRLDASMSNTATASAAHRSSPAPVPTVSVVIPSFNAAHLLREAVASVQSQTGAFELQEVVVVDDASTDPVSQAVLKDVARVPGVQVMPNQRRKGPAGARNTGAFHSRSEWLAFLDADDVYLPGSLKARFDGASAYPDAAVVTADFQIHNMNTGATEPLFFRNRERPRAIYREAYDQQRPARLRRPYALALRTAFCHNCSTLVRRDAFVAVGGYDERLRYKEDHHLWFKLALHADFVLVPTGAFLYRIHDTNMTLARVAPFDYERKMLDLIREAGVPNGLEDQVRDAYVEGHRRNVRWHLQERQYASAVRSALSCVAARWR